MPSPVALYTDPGFGRYSDDAYDRGYKAGFLDGVFYQNYYGTYDQATPCSPIDVKLLVGSVNSHGMQKQVANNYVLQPGETNLGPVMVGSMCGGNSLLKRCILKNAMSSKWLRMQYTYNTTYPGRAADQVSYDQGRLEGYMTCISFDPIAPQPQM